MKLTLTVLTLLIACSAGAVQIDAEKLADAIYRAEGGPRARAPYGILSVKVSGPAEARRVCLNTIRHAQRDFPGGDLRQFIRFLANRYCPASVDPVGNSNWNRNVLSIYGQLNNQNKGTK